MNMIKEAVKTKLPDTETSASGSAGTTQLSIGRPMDDPFDDSGAANASHSEDGTAMISVVLGSPAVNPRFDEYMRFNAGEGSVAASSPSDDSFKAELNGIKLQIEKELEAVAARLEILALVEEGLDDEGLLAQQIFVKRLEQVLSRGGRKFKVKKVEIEEE
jgi:hypothetical protein